MKVKYTALTGWLAFWLAIVLGSDLIASHAGERHVRLGGFFPQINHSTYVLYCWLVVIFILVAWWMAIESSQYWLLISLAVVVGKGGQDFNHVFLGWQQSLWSWLFFVILFGIVLAAVRQSMSDRFILPHDWREAGFGHIPAARS